MYSIISGDCAYPLMVNLMTPFRDKGHVSAERIRYNQILSSIRSVIERAFGLLKGKFRRLKYLDIADPETANKIIAAACMLHNFIIDCGEPPADLWELDTNQHDETDNTERNPPSGTLRQADIKRNELVNLLNN